MNKVDKLLERMVQRRIEAAILVNDQPARFLVAGREATGGVLPASQLQSLVQEIIPTSLWWELSQDGSFEFPYQSPYGIFTIAVERANGSFQVSLAPDCAEQVKAAQALCNEGVRLAHLGQYGEALRIFDEAMQKYTAATDGEVQAQLARAYKSRGVVLYLTGDATAALAAFEEVVQRFGGSTHPAVQGQVGRALLNQAATFFHLGRRTDALAGYEEVLKRFGQQAHPAVRGLVEEARSERNALLGAPIGDSG